MFEIYFYHWDLKNFIMFWIHQEGAQLWRLAQVTSKCLLKGDVLLEILALPQPHSTLHNTLNSTLHSTLHSYSCSGGRPNVERLDSVLQLPLLGQTQYSDLSFRGALGDRLIYFKWILELKLLVSNSDTICLVYVLSWEFYLDLMSLHFHIG